MLLIVISWLYILFSAVNIGTAANRVLRLPSTNLILTFFNGLFFTTIFAGFWAFFFRINWEFHIVLLLINVLIFSFFNPTVIREFNDVWRKLVVLPKHFKILLSAISIIILAKCSLSPFILDNESYYVQTIKWLNEFGYVKGIANVHLYLGQQSGLHLTQSVFNFSFLYKNFNDINGLLLLAGNAFAFVKLNEYESSKKIHFLIVGLLPLANVLLLQFVSAPSPDLPIYILSFIVVFYFIESFNNAQKIYFQHIVLLSLFAILIKPTAIALAFFPVILLVKNKKLFRHLPILVGVSVLVFGLFLGKNYITSGHPFFPIAWNILGADFALPEIITNLYYQQTKLYSFHLGKAAYDKMSTWQLFMSWLTMPKLHGFFNKIAILLVFAVPIIIRKKLKQRAWLWIYGVMIVQLIVLAASSPQYRFFLNFILLFGITIASLIIMKLKIMKLALYLSTIIAAIILFFPLNISSITDNRATQIIHVFAFKNIIVPESNSNLRTEFKSVTERNLHYYSPIKNDFFWGTGDGPLPCVNERQINLFKRKFRIVPQPFSKNLRDGFFSEELQIIE